MRFPEERIKPQTAEEVTECETVEGMRRRIQRYARYDAFTNAVLQSGYVRGLSGEDTMTILAYEALCSLESLREVVLDEASLRPANPFILPLKKEE